MTKISATILVFNEEKRIAACLDSLSGVADEIIVVDSMSTDSTLDICRRYGCKISRRHLDGYGAQRQYATSLASYPYVLSLDADEVLSPALRNSIIALKENGLENHRVYCMSRLNFYCGVPVRRCGWYPDMQIRLFDKRYANWNLHDVGERVIFRDSVRPQRLDGDILHYRCDTGEMFRAVSNNHAAIRARVLAAGNDSIAPGSPLLHGLRAFMKTYFLKGGILEGESGRAIAREAFRSEMLAYSVARRLIKRRNDR